MKVFVEGVKVVLWILIAMIAGVLLNGYLKYFELRTMISVALGIVIFLLGVAVGKTIGPKPKKVMKNVIKQNNATKPEYDKEFTETP